MKHVFAILILLALFPAPADAGHHKKNTTSIVWRNHAGQPMYSAEYILAKHRGRKILKLVKSWRHGPVAYRCMAPHSVDQPGYYQIRGQVRHPWGLPYPWTLQRAASAGNLLGQHAFHTGYDGPNRYLNQAWNNHYPSRLNPIWYIKSRSFLSTPSLCFVPEGYKVCLQPAFVQQGKVTPVPGGHLNAPINVLPYLYFNNVRGVPRKTAMPQLNEEIYYRQAPLEKATLAELGARYWHIRR